MDVSRAARGLDALDLQLLNALVENARITNRQLARLLGIAEPTCTQRRQRLEQVGAILGYTAIVAYEDLALAFRAWFSVRLVSAQAAVAEAFERTLKAESAVATLYTTGGHSDFFFEVRADSFDVARALKARLEKHTDVVAEIKMFPIFKQVSLASE